MKPGGSPAKGGEFERKICSLLSLWLSSGNRDDLFIRNASSGGRFTICMKGVGGDLVAAHPIAYNFIQQYQVECKHHKAIDWDLFMRARGEFYEEEFLKTKKQAEKSNKKWLFISKQNHRPIIVVMPRPCSLPVNKIWHSFFGDTMAVMLLDHLLAMSPTEFVPGHIIERRRLYV